MARSKRASADSPTATSRARTGDVKMVHRHAEFVEPDVEATQAAEEETTVSGPNPYREKTAAWGAFENRKRQDKGLPATNAINE